MLARTCLLLVAVVVLGCSAERESPPGGNPGGSGSGAAPAGPGAGGTGGGPGLDAGTCPETHCSTDLHSVLDCDDKVVEVCPDDQGCAPNVGCVAACDSAIANESTYGCEFYTAAPDIEFDNYRGSCFAAFIANTWTTPIGIEVEYAGQPLMVSAIAQMPSGNGESITYQPLPGGMLPPGEMAIVFLAERLPNPDPYFQAPCPVPPGVGIDAAVHGTGLGSSFRIATTAPVVAYDIFPWGGGRTAVASATLLLPTSTWGMNYVAVNAFRKSTAVPQGLLTTTIIAKEDGTEVTVSPVADIAGGPGVAPTGQGVPATYALSKGQVMVLGQAAELTGTPIATNKPVGVWGGSTAFNIDTADFDADAAHQQLPPVKALGDEYVAVRYRNRYDAFEESVPWRLVGAVDGTVLTYDPAPPAGAPTQLDEREVAEFWAPGPFVVRSQDEKHPFYAAAHMPSSNALKEQACTSCAGGDDRGAPEFVNVVPGKQYLPSYVFFTDPTYAETNLVVVRAAGPRGFADVELDCAGALDGWQPVGTDGKYEYTRIDLVRHDFAPQNGCDNGRHEATSTQPFGITVWGWGSAETGYSPPNGTGFYTQGVSYGYPVGMSVRKINEVVVVPTPK